jgi:hypothetical protein
MNVVERPISFDRTAIAGQRLKANSSDPISHRSSPPMLVATRNEDEMQSVALRWLRGEYVNKTTARQDLDVRTIIDDRNVYDNLKLISRFVRHAGYSGLFVCLDELVTLYKLQSAQSRKMNFDQILRIINDVLQGSAEGIGFALGGTPDFLLDTRRGANTFLTWSLR